MSAAPEKAAGRWRIERHGGSSAHEWRAIKRTWPDTPDGREEATRAYQVQERDLRHGGVRLISPNGAQVSGLWAPKLRARW